MQVFERNLSFLLHIARFVAPFPLFENKKKICTDSSEVALQENKTEEKGKLR